MSMARNIGPIMADHDRGPEYALVQCIGDDFTCPAEARVEQSARLSDADIAAALAERGWSVSPTLCPSHRPEVAACSECGCEIHRCGPAPTHWHHASVPDQPHFPNHNEQERE